MLATRDGEGLQGQRVQGAQALQLHEQLLALKMQNQELEEDNRRARRGGTGVTTGGAAAPPVAGAAAPGTGVGSLPTAGAAALSRSFAHGVKVFRQAGLPKPRQEDVESLGIPAVGGVSEEEELQALRAEVASLEDRVRKSNDELSAARTEAIAAQQAAAAASAAADAPIEVGSAADLRQLLGKPPAEADAAIEADSSGSTAAKSVQETLPFLSDETLLQLSRNICKLAAAHGRHPGRGSATGQADGDALLPPLMRIQEQQRQLDEFRNKIDHQDSQLVRLREQAAAAENSSRHTDKQPHLEERLRDAERHVGELGQRLETSDGVSRQLYELRCQLHVMTERVRHRDRVIEQLLTRQEAQDELHLEVRERLGMLGEDLHSRPTGRGEKQEEAEEEKEQEPSCDARPNPTEDRGVQTQEGDKSGRCSHLRAELERLRADRASSEAKGARELQDLRTLIHNQQQHRAKHGPKRSASTVETYHIGSDVEEEEQAGAGVAFSEGFLYKQKLAELLELHRELERELELLRSSEQLLRTDRQEKEELIAYLLRQAQPEDSAQQQHGDSKSNIARLGRWWAKLRDRKDGVVGEVERETEEALLDNARLRRHLRCLSEELARLVENQQPEG